MAQLGYPTESSQLTSTTYRDFSSPPPKHEWISGAYQEAQEGSQHEGQRPRPKSVGWVSRSKRTLSAQKKKKKRIQMPQTKPHQCEISKCKEQREEATTFRGTGGEVWNKESVCICRIRT